jgi:hypothetical protein
MAISPSHFTGGLQTPIQPAQNGGMRTIEGDDYIKLMIENLSTDCSCDNPFLDIGIGLDAVFSNMSDGGWRAQQQRKIENVFKDLQKAQLAKLISTDWRPGPGEAEYMVTIHYLNIETASESSVETTMAKR